MTPDLMNGLISPGTNHLGLRPGLPLNQIGEPTNILEELRETIFCTKSRNMYNIHDLIELVSYWRNEANTVLLQLVPAKKMYYDTAVTTVAME
jgi:hypothetical protein